MSTHGANQYRPGRRLSPPNPEAELMGQTANRMACGQVWGNKCPVMVGPPIWSHAQHPTPGAQLRTAVYPRAAAVALQHLAKTGEQPIRWKVAGNPACPVATLRALAVDPSWGVRFRVAGNPTTPPDLLRTLAADQHEQVRWGVAENPHAPSSTLERMLQDPDPIVRGCTLDNPSLPRTTLALWELAH
jgi:hypothetical protein